MTSGAQDAAGTEKCPCLRKGPQHNFSFAQLTVILVFPQQTTPSLPRRNPSDAVRLMESPKPASEVGYLLISKWFHVKREPSWLAVS